MNNRNKYIHRIVNEEIDKYILKETSIGNIGRGILKVPGAALGFVGQMGKNIQNSGNINAMRNILFGKGQGGSNSNGVYDQFVAKYPNPNQWNSNNFKIFAYPHGWNSQVQTLNQSFIDVWCAQKHLIPNQYNYNLWVQGEQDITKYQSYNVQNQQQGQQPQQQGQQPQQQGQQPQQQS